MKFLKKICIGLLIFTISNNVYAQADSIDLFVKAQMQKRKIPGLQLAIVKNGKIIKTGNYGLANVQDSIPVSDQTVFTINSITKAFTGVAIMQLGGSRETKPVFACIGLPDRSAGKLESRNHTTVIIPYFRNSRHC